MQVFLFNILHFSGCLDPLGFAVLKGRYPFFVAEKSPPVTVGNGFTHMESAGFNHVGGWNGVVRPFRTALVYWVTNPIQVTGKGRAVLNGDRSRSRTEQRSIYQMPALPLSLCGQVPFFILVRLKQ